MFGSANVRCLSCGVDLWDVDRYVQAGGVVACGRCIEAMSDALGSTEAVGAIEVAVPPRLHGDAPDPDAVAEVSAAVYAVFGGGSAAERAASLEDAETLGPMIEQAAQMYANVAPRLVIDRVRFPTPDLAEVRFRFVLHGGPGGIDGSGRVVRRDGRWVVTRETVLATVPGGSGRIIVGGGVGATGGRVGGVGVDRVALWSTAMTNDEDDDEEPPDDAVPAPV